MDNWKLRHKYKYFACQVAFFSLLFSQLLKCYFSSIWAEETRLLLYSTYSGWILYQDCKGINIYAQRASIEAEAKSATKNISVGTYILGPRSDENSQ